MVVVLDWRKYVKQDKNCLRPLDVDFPEGDSSKAKLKLGWASKVIFKNLVELMVKHDLKCWKRWQSGERFPCEAPN
jgi:GDP-D-mannose dehydratase